MKFNFKVQPYQTDAVEAIARVFSGQPHYEKITYNRDMGTVQAPSQTTFDNDDDAYSDIGYKNEQVELTDVQLLENIRKIQSENNIRLSDSLEKALGKCSIDVEMETGTGKTYVYIKTMFELNKRYGWNKFIVVVPSIAIREGVKKSFEITEEHFMEHYGKKARFFIYNSADLTRLDTFSSGSGINVMIINTQAFASSLKEGANNKESKIIYSPRDSFGSRRPIDVIAVNRPIIILDEPQKMGREDSATQTALKRFNPLFSLYFSATHKKQHNMVYVLDAVDAYNKKLVKKIEVKGFEVKNLLGINQYLYLDSITITPKKAPVAKMEIEIALAEKQARKMITVTAGDDLYYKSNNMEQYKNGFTITEIEPLSGTVTFANGTVIRQGKERLLSFDEPTRFIFSHSALREGWDNPNVFQICTLKHSDSSTQKRQEVGRGLRLCVNRDGTRMDLDALQGAVHDINKLTVIASESYKGFVADIQSDIKSTMYDRPTAATADYFTGKYVKVDGKPTPIDRKTAEKIDFYLIQNGYVDENLAVTDKYRTDAELGTLAPMPESLAPMSEGIHTLVQAIFDDSVLDSMIDNGKDAKVVSNNLNDNFKKKEFQELWRQINHKYAYTVSFDTAELIKKAIVSINRELFVSELTYVVATGAQKDDMKSDELSRGESFNSAHTKTKRLKRSDISQIKYDLVGKIAQNCGLTRKTTAAVLSGMHEEKFYMFRANPEEFIAKVSRLIEEQKATMIVEHISYDQIDGEYDSNIFTADKPTQSYDKAFKAQRHIQDYVFTDGTAEMSVERRFAEDLDNADEVSVYAKLPRGFKIPTPVGNYSPDWAIAFRDGSVKHIFFVAETKGTMETLNLRPIEKAKISCARKLFNEISTEKVRYHDVSSYQNLLDVMKSIK